MQLDALKKYVSVFTSRVSLHVIYDGNARAQSDKIRVIPKQKLKDYQLRPRGCCRSVTIGRTRADRRLRKRRDHNRWCQKD